MSYNSKYKGAEVDAALDLAKSALQQHQDISGKQDTLVSGTNIKTINGESILGSGDITIEGSENEDTYQLDVYCIDLFDGEWDSDSESWIKEYNKLYEAFNQGVRIYFIRYQYNTQAPNFIPCEVSFNNFTYDRFNISFVVSDNYYTGCIRSIGLVFHSNGSVEINGSLLVDVFGEGEKFLSDDGKYKTLRSINGESLFGEGDIIIEGDGAEVPIVDHGTGDTTFVLTPNILHKWGTVTSLTLTLAAPTDTTIANYYMAQFTCGSTATSINLPDTIKWITEPNIEANKTYQISILDNLGVIGGA